MDISSMIPENSDIEIVLLKIISQINEASPTYLYQGVEAFFVLTDAEKHLLYNSGNDIAYSNRVRWATNKLFDEGKICRTRRGLVKLTFLGKAIARQQAEIKIYDLIFENHMLKKGYRKK